jgi:hypothetical protein
MAAFCLMASLCPPTMHIGLSERHTDRPQKPRSSPAGAFLRLWLGCPANEHLAHYAVRSLQYLVEHLWIRRGQWRSIAMPSEFSRWCGWPEGPLFPDQIHGFLTMGKIIAGSSLRRSRNVDLSRTGLVRLPVYRGVDCSVIPDIAAIHTVRVEGQRQSTGAVDCDKPAQPANCS